MRKNIRLDVSQSRWKHPGRTISEFSQKLETQVAPVPGIQEGDSNIAEAPAAGSTQPQPVAYEPGTTVDSYASGALIEEQLTRVGNNFVTSLEFNTMQSVWFDGLEAVFPIHWVLSGNEGIVPTATLIADTEVIGRYTIV